MGSSASSLCTFLPTLTLRQASLRITIPSTYVLGAGFPEFTRSFNHSFLWRLQSGMNLSMTVRVSHRDSRISTAGCSTN